MTIEPSAEIEIYSMASFPTLVVSDIQASARWYCEALGFTHVFEARAWRSIIRAPLWNNRRSAATGSQAA